MLSAQLLGKVGVNRKHRQLVGMRSLRQWEPAGVGGESFRGFA